MIPDNFNGQAPNNRTIKFVLAFLLILCLVGMSFAEAGGYRSLDLPQLQAKIRSHNHPCDSVVGVRPFQGGVPGTVVFCRVGNEIRTYVVGYVVKSHSFVVVPR